MITDEVLGHLHATTVANARRGQEAVMPSFRADESGQASLELGRGVAEVRASRWQNGRNGYLSQRCWLRTSTTAVPLSWVYRTQ